MSAEQRYRSSGDIESGRPPRDRAINPWLVTAESGQTPVLSIVIPTKNEQDAIADCLRRCDRAIVELALPTEIIVSDSSTDETSQIAREMGAIVVHPPLPGYGHAYRHAFDHVRGDYVAIGDADMSYDFTELPALLQPVVSGEADIVLGNRLAGEMERGAMPWLHRYVGNPGLTWVLNRLYGVGVGDSHSGFRVIRRACLDELDLSTGGMEFASEMLIRAADRGFEIKETPITYGRRRGEATLETFRDGWRHVRFMLVNTPGTLFAAPGVALLAGGLAVMAGSYFELSVGMLRPGSSGLIAGSVMLLIGYQLTQFGAYTRLAGTAILPAGDPISQFLSGLSLERSLLSGILVIATGVAMLVLGVPWSTAGSSPVTPEFSDAVVALTLVGVGVQTVFSAFLMRALSQ